MHSSHLIDLKTLGIELTVDYFNLSDIFDNIKFKLLILKFFEQFVASVFKYIIFLQKPFYCIKIQLFEIKKKKKKKNYLSTLVFVFILFETNLSCQSFSNS
jgi:hypothetical protein